MDFTEEKIIICRVLFFLQRGYQRNFNLLSEKTYEDIRFFTKKIDSSPF